MSISMTNPKGITLKTGAKICAEDIAVVPALQTKTASQNGTYTADDGYAGLGSVTVDVPGAAMMEGSLLYEENGTYDVLPDEGFDGFSSLSVTVSVPQSSGTASDPNLLPFNIRSGVTILGVTGTFTGELISFTIAGNAYSALPGMTWAQWCESEYDVNASHSLGRKGWCIMSGPTAYNVHSYGFTSYYIDGVYDTDTIVAGRAYTVQTVGDDV